MANMLRSNNPVLKESAFAGQIAAGEAMTMQGTANKTGLLLLCVVVTAAYTWGLSHSETPEAAIWWMFGGRSADLTGDDVRRRGRRSPHRFTAGRFSGRISALFEKSYPGIATQAVMLTFGCCSCCCWRTKRIGESDTRV
jgi:uncharacterized YccA/Bax inhibitor family protein